MTIARQLSALLFTSALVVAASACSKQEGPAEETGRKIDEAMAESAEKTGEAIEEAGKKVQEEAHGHAGH